MVPAGWDDEELLTALREALRARQAVPPEFVEAAKTAFALHDVHAELTHLTYASSRDSDYDASIRAEAASIRALTFTSTHLTIELEVTHDSLLGQILPAQAGVIKIQPRDGAETEFPADESGCFRSRPTPSRSGRMHCRTAGGIDALTGWITL